MQHEYVLEVLILHVYNVLEVHCFIHEKFKLLYIVHCIHEKFKLLLPGVLCIMSFCLYKHFRFEIMTMTTKENWARFLLFL